MTIGKISNQLNAVPVLAPGRPLPGERRMNIEREFVKAIETLNGPRALELAMDYAADGGSLDILEIKFKMRTGSELDQRLSGLAPRDQARLRKLFELER